MKTHDFIKFDCILFLFRFHTASQLSWIQGCSFRPLFGLKTLCLYCLVVFSCFGSLKRQVSLDHLYIIFAGISTDMSMRGQIKTVSIIFFEHIYSNFLYVTYAKSLLLGFCPILFVSSFQANITLLPLTLSFHDEGQNVIRITLPVIKMDLLDLFSFPSQRR